MRQGIKLVRQLGAALGSALGPEVIPGSSLQTDEEIENWLKDSAANSQYHPACSCGMLPRAQGGCVDSKLRVYNAGTSEMPLSFFIQSTTHLRLVNLSKLISLSMHSVANVRVVDTSVFPYIFAAHVRHLSRRILFPIMTEPLTQLASTTYGLAEQAAMIIQQESFTVPQSNGSRGMGQSLNTISMFLLLWASIFWIMAR